MPAKITVVYPKDKPFDMDYYLATHMPLVQEKWAQYGLQNWEVVKIGGDGPYSVSALLHFNDMAGFQKAANSEEAKEVFGDVKNFTPAEPLVMPGEIVGTS